MELKVQGSLLTEGIIDAILARTDGVTEFDIIGREEELMYELAENVVAPLHILNDFLKPIKEVFVTIEPEDEYDTRLGVRVKMVFEDDDIYETREVMLDVARFDLSGIYRELFLTQIDGDYGSKFTVIYSDCRYVLRPSYSTTYVDFDGRLYNVSRYCEEYRKLEKEIDESRLWECLHEAADCWWRGGLKYLMDDLNNLRFADNWHVQHYRSKYWYALLVLHGDIETTGDVFGGERIYAPLTVGIPFRLLSDAVRQDIATIEKIFKAHLCAIGCDAVALFGD